MSPIDPCMWFILRLWWLSNLGYLWSFLWGSPRHTSLQLCWWIFPGAGSCLQGQYFRWVENRTENAFNMLKCVKHNAYLSGISKFNSNVTVWVLNFNTGSQQPFPQHFRIVSTFSIVRCNVSCLLGPHRGFTTADLHRWAWYQDGRYTWAVYQTSGPIRW